MKTFFYLSVFVFLTGAAIAVWVHFESQKPTLAKVVEKAMKGVTGRYAIVIENYATGERYIAKEHEVFDSGSLYKLWVMALAFDRIKKGQLQKDDVLSQDIAELNRKFVITEDEAELTEGSINMTVFQAMQQMIIISHNYAALLLSEKLTNSQISKFAKDQGFFKTLLGSNTEPPKTTASDVALFYKRLYKGEFVDKESSKEMLELLKKQQLNDGLPKLLPKGTSVAHKTGDIGWFKHDAGLVFIPQGDYVIVVLSESNSPIRAQAKIAELSKAVFDYFTTLTNT